MKTFRPYAPRQSFLLPPSPLEWLPEDHLAYFILDVVSQLDLSKILEPYEREERGYPPHHPQMMLGLLLYGYCVGVPSSRKIERKTHEDVAFRVVAGGTHPDHSCIADFRARHREAFAEIFGQVLKLCMKAKLVKLGHVALDGTKMKANASKHKAMSYDRMKKLEAEAKAQAAADRKSDDDDAPPASGSAPLPKHRIPREGDDAPAPKAQRNFTDPESRIQKTGDGFIQGYNCQAAVDAEHQIIVAEAVTNQPPDVEHFAPMLERVVENCGAAPKAVSADSGYFSEKNVAAAQALGIDPHIATGRQKRGEPAPTPPRGRPPAALTPKQKMTLKLLTRAGKAIYSRRKVIAEPPFGQIKQARGLRQFLMRGVAKVRSEWSLICLTHNLLKLHGAKA